MPEVTRKKSMRRNRTRRNMARDTGTQVRRIRRTRRSCIEIRNPVDQGPKKQKDQG